MALLNYSVPFLNVPTPAPFYSPSFVPPPSNHPVNGLYGAPPPPAANTVNTNPPSYNNHPYNGQPQYQQQQQTTSRTQGTLTTFSNIAFQQQQQQLPPRTPSTTVLPPRAAAVFPPNFKPFQSQQPQQQQQQQQQRPFEDPRGFAANGGAEQPYPTRPIEYKRVDPDKQKTSIHPIIDYDNEYEYYDDDTGQPLVTAPVKPLPLVTHVTPIQGPIFLKNGTVPVVPLYSYPVINNGTFIQIPILWTALSVALGLELRGEIIRGVPCIKRYHQLFCPTAGNSYPIDRIELFIDENKALMKRMYGDFIMSPEFNPARSRKKKRSTSAAARTNATVSEPVPWAADLHADPIPDPIADKNNGESYFAKLRKSRQSSRPSPSSSPSSNTPPFRNNQSSESGRVDACESKVEIVTPYWASNSAGKIRAIVNTQHFEQAIHQEVCSKMRTNRCSGDCGCEQKYKWHRLLAYDPDNDCKGIFMDWFLFPSCCVCRCNPT